MTKKIDINIITVKNAPDEPDTQAQIVVQNQAENPLVSVIIPVYNVAQYLPQCLDSVINQTLHSIEIICVDDGSTDGSLDILQEYAQKDSRITIIRQANSGAGIARNCGMSVAVGEFLAFMDPDDYYPANTTLEHLYNAAHENNVDICGGTVLRLKDNELTVAPEYLFNKYGIIQYSDYQFDYGYWRFIYNRKLLNDNNVLFPDYLRQQDPVFFVNAMIAAGKFYAVNEPTYVYRVSHTQKQIEWSKRKCQDVAKSLRDLLVLSDKSNLVKLHKTVADRVIQHYFINIFKNLVDSNGVPDENLVRLLESLNYKMIYAENPAFSLPWFYKSNPNLCKISVIIPVYNVEKWLTQCLNSVINQTYKNLEILCINDGSTDGSLKILEKHADKDKRIRIISQQNAGLNGARNTGLHNATGAYITFLDSDDWLDLSWIEKAYNVAIKNNAELVKSGYLHHYEDWIEPDSINETIDAKAARGKYLGINENNIIVWSTLYETAFIRKNNLFFDEHIWKHEDILYTLKATFLANKIMPLSGVYVNYRRTSSILSAFNKHVYDLLPIINDKAISFLNNIDCTKADYVAAVKHLWWRTNDAFEKRNSIDGFDATKQREYLDKNYEIFRRVRYRNDIFDADTMKKLGISDSEKTALVAEINDCHGECLPGYVKYLLDLGYTVDVLINTVQESEKPMYMFDGNPKVRTIYLSDKEILKRCNSDYINEYNVCIFNSNTLYKYGLKSVTDLIKLYRIKPQIMCVEHRLEFLPKLKRRATAIVIKSFPKSKGAFEVNPHYFGTVAKHSKNKITNFVVAGNIQKTRKNYDLLINTVSELVNKGITNFKITVIGHGNLGDLPKNIQSFFDIKGRVSYPDLYKYVSDADFFLTLLDPENKKHNRYLKLGTSGSFQLIYGLNIPCLIAKKFAVFHRFSSDNSIVYDANADLADAMLSAIRMNDMQYKEKKECLLHTAQEIYKESLEHINVAISTKRNKPIHKLMIWFYELTNSKKNRIKWYKRIFSINRHNEYSHRMWLFGFKIMLTNKQKMLQSKLDRQHASIITAINNQTDKIMNAISKSNTGKKCD